MLALGIVIVCCDLFLPDRDYGYLIPHARFPGVLVSDGLEFPVDAHSANATRIAARDHMSNLDWYMQTWYYPKSYRLWRQEAEWAHDCWDQLDNYYRARQDSLCDGRGQYCARDRKMFALMKLKELLGDEAYNARAMPTPIPTWLK